MLKGENNHSGKKVLIPLFYHYYLFDYFQELVPQLILDGFRVTIITNDQKIKQQFEGKHQDIEVVPGPPPLVRACHNRGRKGVVRILFWLFGWSWVWKLKQQYDFVIVPWDYKVLWYLLSRVLPSLTVHNVTDFLDVELKLGEHYFPVEKENILLHKILFTLDKLCGGTLLPKANRRILKYPQLWFIDRLMGYRHVNGQQGFSGVNYLTVMGDSIKKNYETAGLTPGRSKTKVIVTGSPSYEGILAIPNQFNMEERHLFRQKLGIPNSARLFSFFLSPSSYTEIQEREVVEVVEAIHRENPGSYFILKFHPKTRKGDPERIMAHLSHIEKQLVLIKDFHGDVFNAKLILSSYCIVQKQSTVGYIAMMYAVPVVSYNIYETDYDDDMYRLIGGSFHSETLDELIHNIKQLDDPIELKKLKILQDEACRKFCTKLKSPCGEISKVIQTHFSSATL
ncbi:MAG: hypothetical protein COB67_04165 [SAR324 cluster bacterium]|uniref:Uncharacterized protein n=1 Tax=SAR324 cluster bacterium TaxID=2024889 RepID=A0A2A4T7K6_9DELT|nr:MAG: hypothetical protein COB67_04165 [SAR324 cluster bacterium]